MTEILHVVTRIYENQRAKSAPLAFLLRPSSRQRLSY
jgi:hypothetical protein